MLRNNWCPGAGARTLVLLQMVVFGWILYAFWLMEKQTNDSDNSESANLSHGYTMEELSAHQWNTNNLLTNMSEKLEEKNVVSIPTEKCPYYKNPRGTEENSENMTEAEFYRKRPEKVNRFVYNVTLNGESVCGFREDEGTDLVILVNSSPQHLNRRDAIRHSWGSITTNRGQQWPGHLGPRSLNVTIGLGFVLGINTNVTVESLVDQESMMHNDIIKGDFYDHYSNMTLKSLLGLKWASENCPGAKYLLKSDDDMVINIPYLLQLLKKLKMSRGILGPYNPDSKVVRAPGKWCLPKRVFPFTHFPPYYSGSAYVITFDILRELYETSEYVPPNHIDDVYITGILAKIIGAKHFRRGRFAYAMSRSAKPCDILLNRVVSSTNMSAKDLLLLWKQLHHKNNKCQ